MLELLVLRRPLAFSRPHAVAIGRGMRADGLAEGAAFRLAGIVEVDKEDVAWRHDG
jgi:hypothetical protein